jgi:hypothetical protein
MRRSACRVCSLGGFTGQGESDESWISLVSLVFADTDAWSAVRMSGGRANSLIHHGQNLLAFCTRLDPSHGVPEPQRSELGGIERLQLVGPQKTMSSGSFNTSTPLEQSVIMSDSKRKMQHARQGSGPRTEDNRYGRK